MVTKDPGAWKPKPMPALDGDLREIRVFFSNWLKYYADFFLTFELHLGKIGNVSTICDIFL